MEQGDIRMDATTTENLQVKKNPQRNKTAGRRSARKQQRSLAKDILRDAALQDELSREAFSAAADDMFHTLLQWCFANKVAPARGLREVVTVLGETLHETVADEESELAKEIDLAAYEACTLLADEVMYRVFGKLAESGEGDARDLALAMDQLSAFMRDMGSPEAFLEACVGD